MVKSCAGSCVRLNGCFGTSDNLQGIVGDDAGNGCSALLSKRVAGNCESASGFVWLFYGSQTSGTCNRTTCPQAVGKLVGWLSLAGNVGSVSLFSLHDNNRPQSHKTKMILMNIAAHLLFQFTRTLMN